MVSGTSTREGYSWWGPGLANSSHLACAHLLQRFGPNRSPQRTGNAMEHPGRSPGCGAAFARAGRVWSRRDAGGDVGVAPMRTHWQSGLRLPGEGESPLRCGPSAGHCASKTWSGPSPCPRIARWCSRSRLAARALALAFLRQGKTRISTDGKSR